MNISFNPALNHALDLMENTYKNLLITGKAGTGKSTLLTYFRMHTKKNIVVLAPTGVAALNIQGQTIHSFFRFKHSVTRQSIRRINVSKQTKNMYKKLDAVVIDEISMVRADLLDCVDLFLQLNGKNPTRPFGGVQMIFIGDFYQLPPVVTAQEREIFLTHYKSPYFFGGHFFKDFKMDFVELDKIFRQQDVRFIHLLNAIRNATVTKEDMEILNQRVLSERSTADLQGYVCLTPTNKQANNINMAHLDALKGEPLIFHARIEGTFGREYYPTQETLALKSGAQIMMVNNNPDGHWLNGTMGKVLDIKKKDARTRVIICLEDGKEVEVEPHTWEINRFFLEEEVIKTEVIGSFIQYPLTLAWAITIHKSQGKTFKKVIFDIGNGAFMPGQVYVALSRCTSLEGLILKKPLHSRHIWSDEEVVKFESSLKRINLPMHLSVEEVTELLKCSLHEKRSIEIVYLNACNEKSTRIVTPTYLGLMKYQNVSYLGIKAFCWTCQEYKVFRVDRIMAITVSRQ